MVSSEVSSEVKSFLDWQISKILISERNNLALSNKKSELILPSLVQLAELYTEHFGACRRCERTDLGTLWKETLEAGISVFAMLIVLEGLPWRILLAVVPDREVVWVLARSVRVS